MNGWDLDVFIILEIPHFFNILSGEHIVLYLSVLPAMIDEQGHKDKGSGEYGQPDNDISGGIIKGFHIKSCHHTNSN